ncbi:MAG: anhydro-N-acetylmuramic acid kinase [Bacteroidales bacterium]
MNSRTLVTGLMSGSSLDGVDLACCRFIHGSGRWRYEIIAAETFPYPTPLRRQLEAAMGQDPGQLKQLDLEIGAHYGTLLNSFHQKYHILPGLIASHGHTIFHEPSRGITLQVGNGKVMAETTWVTVVNHFRNADVAQGGQGAPLVPVGDRLLFGAYGACLNLGGFSNISFDMAGGVRMAYDTGPCNLGLNRIASLLRKPYDPEGSIARTGKVEERLLEVMNRLPYYALPPPKSLGREWFQTHFLPFIEDSELPVNDLMATTVEHLACHMGAAINQSAAEKVLVTGGGAFNLFLLERISGHTRARLVVPDNLLVAYKEARVFALLGLLRIRGEINCLASATGGKRDLSAGEINSPE